MTVVGARAPSSDNPGFYEQDAREARIIFERILSAGSSCVENARVESRSESYLNGDVVVSEETDGGLQQFLIGDFTGHGLSAAVGTLFASQVVRSMVRKGLSQAAVIQELHATVCHILPVGRFLAACLLRLEPATGVLEIWNAALPSVLIWNPRTGLRARFGSRHPPLGALRTTGPDPRSVTVRLEQGDRILAATDGLTEARGPGGALLGERWLEQVVTSWSGEGWLVDAVLDAFDRQGATSGDDISLLEIVPPAPSEASSPDRGRPSAPPAGRRFRVELQLQAEELRAGASPSAALHGALATLDGFDDRDRGFVHTVMSELFANAVEHGLLGLDSSIKATPEGFLRYLELRSERLASLGQGTVRIWLERDRVADVLEIGVAHDGAGFDPEAVQSRLAGNAVAFGRGLAIVRSLCEGLEFSDQGRTATARFRPRRGAAGPPAGPHGVDSPVPRG